MSNKPYKPKLTQIYYWRAYADPHVKPTMMDTARRAVEMMREEGVTPKEIPKPDSLRQMVYRWDEEEGYEEWREAFWQHQMNKLRPFLDKVGVLKSPNDFKYWEAMQTKFGGYQRSPEIEINNNTDLKEVATLLQEIYKNESKTGSDKASGAKTVQKKR